jgi:hypothetical protein
MSNTIVPEMRMIRKQFDDLQNMFQSYLLKVDPDLIYDLLTRLRENPTITPVYTLEVFTKAGVDPIAVRDYIYKITGTIPTVIMAHIM